MDGVAVVLAQPGWWDGHLWGWGGWWMGVSMALFWLVVVGLIVWLVRATDGDRSSQASEPRERARDILAERYARGEIDTVEYEKRLASMR